MENDFFESVGSTSDSSLDSESLVDGSEFIYSEDLDFVFDSYHSLNDFGEESDIEDSDVEESDIDLENLSEDNSEFQEMVLERLDLINDSCTQTAIVSTLFLTVAVGVVIIYVAIRPILDFLK